MKTIFKESISQRKPPVNITPQDITLFQHEYEKVIHKTTFLELTRVFVLNNMIFSPKAFRFYHAYSLVNPVRQKAMIKNVLLLRKPQVHVEAAIWITDENAYGYFHWLTDCLSRLVAMEPFLTNHVVVLADHLKQIPFIDASLSYFNIKALYYATDRPLNVRHLLLPSHTAPSGNYNKDLIQRIRQRITGSFSDTAQKRIYISRQQAEKRKITNEAEVIALLSQYGFESHCFENYDFTTQVNLMKESHRLIGLHGAGLTNMLFMREGSRVLELRNAADAHNNCYFSLASDLGLPYYYQLNTGDREDTHNVNITVDLVLLEANVKAMLA